MQGQCLCSLFSSFSPREWVGSKALTHQQVPFGSFLTPLASAHPAAFPSSVLHSLSCYILSSPYCYIFISLFVLWPLPFPSLKSLFSSLSLFSLSHIIHIPIVLSCFPTQALLLLHLQFNLILFHKKITYRYYMHSSFHLFASLDYRLLSFLEECLKSEGGGQKSGEETRLPRARGTAYPYQTSTCLLDPPGHTTLFT